MSRNRILDAIRNNKPEPFPLPVVGRPAFAADVRDAFIENINMVGGNTVEMLDAGQIQQTLSQSYPEAKAICSTVPDIVSGNIDPVTVNDPHALAGVDLAIVRGVVGVAENGAVWIPGSNMVHRVLPFITQHLVILLSVDRIVPTMHDAYTYLGDFNQGYGVFISGPSKTADIEQSLVIGAHGPLSLDVLLVPDTF